MTQTDIQSFNIIQVIVELRIIENSTNWPQDELVFQMDEGIESIDTSTLTGEFHNSNLSFEYDPVSRVLTVMPTIPKVIDFQKIRECLQSIPEGDQVIEITLQKAPSNQDWVLENLEFVFPDYRFEFKDDKTIVATGGLTA